MISISRMAASIEECTPMSPSSSSTTGGSGNLSINSIPPSLTSRLFGPLDEALLIPFIS